MIKVVIRHVVIHAHFSMQSFHCVNKLFLRAWEGGGGLGGKWRRCFLVVGERKGTERHR